MKYLLLVLIAVGQFMIINLSYSSGRLDGMKELLDKMEKDLEELKKNKIEEE